MREEEADRALIIGGKSTDTIRKRAEMLGNELGWSANGF